MANATNHRALLADELLCASRVLDLVQEGVNLPEAVLEAISAEGSEVSSANSSVDQRIAVHSGAVRDLAAQAVRQWGLTESLIRLMASRPPAAQLQQLLQVSLAQLLSDSVLAEGDKGAALVVNQTVQACKSTLDLEPMAAFVNALLRRFLRERAALIATAQQEPQARHNYPEWWVESLNKAWGEDAASAAMKSTQSPPPITLRINRRWGTPADYLRLLEVDPEQVDGFSPPGSAAVILQDRQVLSQLPRQIEQWPGFAEGWFSVQDLTAQCAATLLDVLPGQRVLDACAAPGGKTTHLLEFLPESLIAAELEAARMVRIQQNLQRYQAWGAERVTLWELDLKRLEASYDESFDRILIDAPCSASGIVRRHPEIRWLRDRGDLATLAAEQKALLTRLWQALKPGGKLLYATCSVFPEENDNIVRSFVDKTDSAQWLSLESPWPGMNLVPGKSKSLRFLPNDGVSTGSSRPLYAHDGFYLALLEKRSG